MIRVAPPPGEKLGEQDRPVEVVQPTLHPLQGSTGVESPNTEKENQKENGKDIALPMVLTLDSSEK